MKIKLNIILLMLSISTILKSQPGKVLSYQRISYNVGGCNINPDSIRSLGHQSCFLGDLDHDGRKEIFTTSPGGLGLGYILSLNSNGTVYKSVTIGRNKGFADNATSTWLSFGASCANIGDVDKDGVTDLAIGNAGESGYGGDVFIVFLNSDGTVKNYKVLTPGKNGFNATLGTSDKFGSSITCLGDIDNNGTTELVVGAPYTNDGGSEAGAIWILSIDSTGFCTDNKKISHTSGGGNVLGLIAKPFYRFGASSCIYKDIDGDKINEFFVGAPFAEFNGVLQGIFYSISINANKTLKSYKLIADTSQNFGDTLINPTCLSRSIGNLGDLDSNGYDDIAVGTTFQGGNIVRGQIRVLLMESNFHIKSNIVWDSLLNGIPAFSRGTDFGLGITGLGDINKDGKLDALVGLPSDYTDHNLYGAMYVLFLDGKKYTTQSIETRKNNSKITAYPNPINVGENIMVSIPQELVGQNITVSLTSTLGQKIISGNYVTNSNMLTMEENNLSSGLYFLSVTHDNEYYYTTLMVK